jgi:hypothetical protein
MIIGAGEDVEKQEPLNIADGIVNKYNHFGKQCRRFHKRLKMG